MVLSAAGLILGGMLDTFRLSLADVEEELTTWQKVKKNWIYPIRSALHEIGEDVWYLLGGNFLSALSTILGTIILLYLIIRFLKPQIRKGIQYAKGYEFIEGESMVPGVCIQPAIVVPTFQVEVYKSGIFVDTFVGFAIRVRDMLVVPGHVINIATVDGKFVLRNKGKSLVLNNAMIQSPKVNDICYQALSQSTWSVLGVSAASIARVTERPVAVTLAGKGKSAVGYAVKSVMPHLLKFNGSTVPGFSGAAYVTNGAAYGIHLGVANDGNVGAALESLDYDIMGIMHGEAARFTDGSSISSSEPSSVGTSRKSRKMKTWSPSQIRDEEEDLYEEYLASGERHKSFDQYLEERPKKVKGESALSEDFADMSMLDLQAVVSAAKARIARLQAATPPSTSRSTVFTPQADTETVFQSVLEVADDPIEELRSLVLPLVTEVQIIKARLDALETTQVQTKSNPSSPNPFSCDACNRSFKTANGRAVHKLIKHTQIVGESAPVPTHNDENDKVQVRNSFLGKTEASTRTKKTTSTSASPTLKPKTQSTSGSRSRSPVKDIQEQLLECLLKLQSTISGPKEEPAQ